MMKQPKFFVSKTKAIKPSVSVETPSVEVVHSETTVPVSHPLVAVVRTNLPRFAVFTIGTLTLGSLALLVGLSTGVVKASLLTSSVPVIFQKSATTGVTVAQAKVVANQGLNFDIQTADARVEIVRAFLERYKSPLAPYDHFATELVAAADRYGLDYRLLPAIMMQESNLCKSSDPTLHNCLGFGIHERGTLGFDTYEESFDRAARELKANYIDQGLVTPEQIMKKYTPSSNGSWANSVNQWIAEMEFNDREEGKTATADANLLEYTAKR